MVTKFSPEADKVYFINEYSLYQVLSGSGSIAVDFKNYFDWEDKIIYLNKGQYIKFSTDHFTIRKITFADEDVFKSTEFRVLFKHLVSLGYINFAACTDCQRYLNQAILTSEVSSLIDVSSEQWYWQNPFNAKKEEYHLIFDVKDVIDKEYSNHLTNEDLTLLLRENGHEAMSLVKDKIGLTVRSLLSQKRLLESQKQVSFSDKSIKEIAYDLGFKDPAYFNRVFNKATGKNPMDFRADFDFEGRDHFAEDIRNLLINHHHKNRSLSFYADQMHLSVKALSRKVKAKMNASLGQLIRNELIYTAKNLLDQQVAPTQIARQLSFEEPNHFTAFFKHHTGLAPTEYQKYKQ